MVSQGVSMLWSSFVNPKKVNCSIAPSVPSISGPPQQGIGLRHGSDPAHTFLQTADRLNMRMSELVENVSKKPVEPWVKNLLVEVMVNDENDEDVEVSSVVLFLGEHS